MVDIDCSADARKTRIIMSAAPDIRVPSSSSSSSPPLRSPRRLASPKTSARAAAPAPSAADVAAYEQYLRLPELSALWADDEFPHWKDERVLRPALQALEITFRFASLVLSDRRPYADRRLWARRVEGLAAAQVQLIADLVAGDEGEEQREERAEQEGGSSRSSSSASLSTCTHGGGNSNINARLRGAPVSGVRSGSMPSSPTSSSPNLAAAAFPMSKARSSEVWKLPGEAPVVSRTSEESLLPLLATWGPSKPLASRILDEIEAQFKGGRCPFTLGVGEPNLDGKPALVYDQVCRPAALHALKLAKGGAHGEASQVVFTAHQVLECWAQVARQLLRRISASVAASDDNKDGGFSEAASDCWALERVWKLLAEVEDLLLLVDPDDFLRLKARLALSGPALCFRSKGLTEAARESTELRRHVPTVLGVEADPTGGPALQDAAMDLFCRRANVGAAEAPHRRVHLLQAFQAVDAAVKKFFFAYRQVVVAVMGSLEVEAEAGDPLAQMFMEPPCCPSIDAAKTFLGDHYCRRQRRQQLQARGPAPTAAGEKPAQPALTHL